MLRKRKKEQEFTPFSRDPNETMLYGLNRNIPNDAYTPSNTGRRPIESFGQEQSEIPDRTKRHRSWKKIIKRSFVTIFLLLLISGGWVGWKFVSNEVKVFGWDGLWSLIHPGPLNSQDGRVNILIAGDSEGRTDGQGGQQLTDSIMIVSIDTQDHTAFMLSVPRDLYVNIPGFGYSKINATAEDGASSYSSQPSYLQNGMGLLEQVVSQKFGIPIDYYALVNYTAFENAVNAVGGISVNIQSADSRGLYDPSPVSPTDSQPLVNLSNGIHELNGQEALNLARARGDAAGSYGYANSDFTRTQNQRLMLLAIKSKAISAGVISNPIRVGDLFDALGNNVQTNLTLGNAKQLYDALSKIPNAQISSEGLNSVNGQDLLKSYRTGSGEDTLVPAAGLTDYSQIQAFVSQLISGQ